MNGGKNITLLKAEMIKTNEHSQNAGLPRSQEKKQTYSIFTGLAAEKQDSYGTFTLQCIEKWIRPDP